MSIEAQAIAAATALSYSEIAARYTDWASFNEIVELGQSSDEPICLVVELRAEPTLEQAIEIEAKERLAGGLDNIPGVRVDLIRVPAR